MTWKEAIYLAFAIVGGVSVTYYNALHVIETGVPLWNVFYFYEQGSTTRAATSMAWDVSVTGLAFVVFTLLEGRRIKQPYTWVFALIPFVHSIALAAPLFLFFRERHLRLGAKREDAP